MVDKCIWAGASGIKYEYHVHLIETQWNDVPGNYIFARQPSPGKWQAIYIGETESLKDQLTNHNALPCIRHNGGTHIHARVNRDSFARMEEEADLLASHTTPCNR